MLVDFPACRAIVHGNIPPDLPACLPACLPAWRTGLPGTSVEMCGHGGGGTGTGIKWGLGFVLSRPRRVEFGTCDPSCF